ncbi:MAG: hypothetical protein AB7O62_19650 [Pirellulales bacterium]
MRVIGKALQLIALILLPLGMVAQLSNAITLGKMLVMLMAGVTAFYLGRILEGYAQR